MMTRLQQLLSGDIVPGVYRYSSRAAGKSLCQRIDQAGWLCFCIDGRAIIDKLSFLNAFAAGLNFPAYFGHNWDAFEECLIDLSGVSLSDKKGVVILYDYAGLFAWAEPHEWSTALDIFKQAVAARLYTSAPLVVLLRGAGIDATAVETF